jgi:hypothetical protein
MGRAGATLAQAEAGWRDGAPRTGSTCQHGLPGTEPADPTGVVRGGSFVLRSGNQACIQAAPGSAMFEARNRLSASTGVVLRASWAGGLRPQPVLPKIYRMARGGQGHIASSTLEASRRSRCCTPPPRGISPGSNLQDSINSEDLEAGLAEGRQAQQPGGAHVPGMRRVRRSAVCSFSRYTSSSAALAPRSWGLGLGLAAARPRPRVQTSCSSRRAAA